MSEKINGAALDWDSPIANEGRNFHLFPEGAEVHFEVTDLTRATSRNLNCPMAKLKLRVFEFSNPDLENVIIENLVLHTSCEWKLCEFFTAIGQRRHGDKLAPDWSAVVGATGRCKLGIDTFTKRDGSEGQANRVRTFLEPLDAGLSEPAF